MGLSLNKITGILLLAFAFNLVNAQEKSSVFDPEDYKDANQFEKFRKRKNVIAAWQINELKEGAIVVRLKTNKKLIDALKTQGKNELALEKEKEQYAINKNTLYAYRDYLTFCKVYFINSNSTDSLLNGARTGMFLDSNLNVDPSITLTEKFFLIAERDYAYNSSIGFVPEDSARKVVEEGNPVREMAIVLKNKYSHQLKGPMPYFIKEKNFLDATFDFPITVLTTPEGKTTFSFQVNKTYFEDIKGKNQGKQALTTVLPANSKVKLKKQFSYEKISIAVDQLNDNLNYFYKHSAKPDLNKIEPEVKKFLY